MRFSTAKFIGIFFACVLLLNACSKIENTNLSAGQANQSSGERNEKNNAQVVKDDVEELGKIIKFTQMPKEATYREDDFNQSNKENQASALNRKKLTAVLKFSTEDAAQIVEQAEKYKPAVQSEIDAEMWFPAELIAQSQLSGDETLKGASFAADDFIQPPYTNGKITRLANTNYFVLELTTF